MKIVFAKVKKRNLLLAGLSGLCISILVWMVTLPSGFISKQGMVFSAVVFLGVTLACYKLLTPYFIYHYRQYKFRPWISFLVLVLLSGIAHQKVISQPRLIFPFLPKQTFALTLNSDQLSFRPVECDLTTLYSKAFSISGGDLERVDSTLMVLSGKGAMLSWTGWVGESCEFTVVNSDDDVNADVSWNGKHTVLNNLPKMEEYPVHFSFESPLFSKLSIFLVVFLACASGLFFLTCGFIALTTPGDLGEQPASVLRNAKWVSPVLTGGFFLFDITLFLRLFAPLNPVNYIPGRDQSVFLYVGGVLLSGQVPYKDVWDHKGPVIYFINALANWVDPAGQWGGFILLFLFLAGTLITGYFLLRRKVGTCSLWVSLTVFLGLLLTMKTFDNLIEVYALVFLALGLLAIVWVIENEDTRKMFLFGITGALVFCLRPNLVSLFIVGGLAWFIMAIIQKQKTGKGVLLFGLGLISVLLPIAVFFLARGAMADLVDQVFTYNFRYIESSGIGLWDKLTIYSSHTLPVVLIGLLGIQYTVGVGRQNKTDRQNTSILFLLTAIFFLELVLSRLSGYDFQHYSLPLMMFAVIIFAIFAESVGEGVRRYRSGVLKLILFACTVLGLAAGSFWNIFTLATADKSSILPEYLQAANLHQFHTRPTLLVWGAEVEVNYLSGIPSPTRYVYQYPLMNDAYCTPEIGQEFTNDIKANLPVILDASHGNVWISPLDAEQRKQAEGQPHNYGSLTCLNDFFDFFDENYSPAYSMVGRHWTIYLPKNAESP